MASGAGVLVEAVDNSQVRAMRKFEQTYGSEKSFWKHVLTLYIEYWTVKLPAEMTEEEQLLLATVLASEGKLEIPKELRKMQVQTIHIWHSHCWRLFNINGSYCSQYSEAKECIGSLIDREIVKTGGVLFRDIEETVNEFIQKSLLYGIPPAAL